MKAKLLSLLLASSLLLAASASHAAVVRDYHIKIINKSSKNFTVERSGDENCAEFIEPKPTNYLPANSTVTAIFLAYGLGRSTCGSETSKVTFYLYNTADRSKYLSFEAIQKVRDTGYIAGSSNHFIPQIYSTFDGLTITIYNG